MKKFIFSIVFAFCMISFAQESFPLSTDGGLQAVLDLQQEPSPKASTAKNASQLLQDLMAKKGFNSNWDDKKKRSMVVGSADFKCENPAEDPTFHLKREMAAKTAVLLAKAKIIEFCNTDMSASDMIDLPGTPVEQQLRPDAIALEAKITKVAGDLSAQKVVLTSAEAEELSRKSLGGRFTIGTKACIDALIEKVGQAEKVSSDDAAAQEKVAAAKAALEEIQAQYDKLIEEAEAAKSFILQEKTTSNIETRAKMPLCGATVVMQTESWDPSTGVFHVAVLVSWSFALEKSARAMLTGKVESLPVKENGLDVHAWLAKQDLATMIGPRQFLDKNGDRWFLGVTARKCSDEDMTSVQRRKAKGAAELFAKQMAVFSLLADVESYKVAVQGMQKGVDGNNKEVAQAAEDYAEKLSQSFSNRTVRGLQQLLERENVIDPISGQPMVVCVYGISAKSAVAALSIERINIEAAMAANVYQQVEKGRNAAKRGNLDASKNVKGAYETGANEQAAALKELQSANEQPIGGVRIEMKGTPQGGSKPAPRSSQGGIFGGDTSVDDDF